jgi:hypothetical protein
MVLLVPIPSYSLEESSNFDLDEVKKELEELRQEQKRLKSVQIQLQSGASRVVVFFYLLVCLFV